MPILMEMPSYFAVSETRQYFVKQWMDVESNEAGMLALLVGTGCSCDRPFDATFSLWWSTWWCDSCSSSCLFLWRSGSYLYSVYFDTFRHVGNWICIYACMSANALHILKIYALTANVSISPHCALRPSRLSAMRTFTARSFFFYFHQNDFLLLAIRNLHVDHILIIIFFLLIAVAFSSSLSPRWLGLRIGNSPVPHYFSDWKTKTNRL